MTIEDLDLAYYRSILNQLKRELEEAKARRREMLLEIEEHKRVIRALSQAAAGLARLSGQEWKDDEDPSGTSSTDPSPAD